MKKLIPGLYGLVRFISIILVFMLVFSLPITSYAAKPGGGGGTAFNSTITITPSTSQINLGESILLKANWSTSLGVNRSQWLVDGIEQQPVVTMKSAKTSGTSSFTFQGLREGMHTVTFKIWNASYAERTASKSIEVTVNSSIVTPTIRYVSLGDSIATGTTSPITSPTKPYTDQFHSFLGTSTPGAVIIRNEFETDGDRTNELLAKLKTNTQMRDAVGTADIITVSIGGNNLMQACKTLLGLYDFFNPNVSTADKGYADFIAQWGQIMAEIRNLNPNAKLIVMTQYNPYNKSDTYMYNFVNSYYTKTDGTGMNDLVASLASTYNYKVADIFSAFDSYSDGRMDQVTLLYPPSFTRNPHPNQNGQNIIFELHKAIDQAP